MKILYVINKMTNLAGIQRILTCKMNYLSEKPEYDVYLLTYEQPDQALSFQINKRITSIVPSMPPPFVDNRTHKTGKLLPHMKNSSKRSDFLRFYAYLCHVIDDFACLDLQH